MSSPMRMIVCNHGDVASALELEDEIVGKRLEPAQTAAWLSPHGLADIEVVRSGPEAAEVRHIAGSLRGRFRRQRADGNDSGDAHGPSRRLASTHSQASGEIAV